MSGAVTEWQQVVLQCCRLRVQSSGSKLCCTMLPCKYRRESLHDGFCTTTRKTAAEAASVLHDARPARRDIIRAPRAVSRTIQIVQRSTASPGTGAAARPLIRFFEAQ